MSNWIALNRDVVSHWLVGFGQPVKPADERRGAFSRGEAWIDLIALARWKPGTESNKGRKVDLDVGQLQGGHSFLAERWNWTVKQVRLFLDKLVQEHMVARGQPLSTSNEDAANSEAVKKGKQLGNQVQIVTLCNYRKYQIAAEIADAMEGQARGKRGASEGQHLNKETRIQEEDTHTHTVASEPEAAQACAWPDGDFVKANGTAIYVALGGKRIQFPYDRVDAWAEEAKCPTAVARKIVETEAQGWLIDGAMPAMPSKYVRSQISQWKPEKAATPAKSGGRKRGTKARLPADWALPLDWRADTAEKFGLTADQISGIEQRFARYWTGPDAKNPMKSDWKRAWEDWVDRSMQRGELRSSGTAATLPERGETAYAKNGNYTGATLF